MLMLNLGSRELNEFYNFAYFYSSSVLYEFMNVKIPKRGHIILLEVIYLCSLLFKV